MFRFCKNTNFESNSQHFLKHSDDVVSCLDSAKIQILKAIHNGILASFLVDVGCLDSAKIQILKAIHNCCGIDLVCVALFRFCKNTNFESNSQHFLKHSDDVVSCLDSAKIQILKAIHNKSSRLLQS